MTHSPEKKQPFRAQPKMEVDLLRYWSAAVFTGLIASFAGITLVRVAGDVFDTPLFVSETGGSDALVPLTDGRVFTTTMLATLAAAATLNLMLYLVPKAETFFVTLSLVVLASTLLWPIALDGTTEETVWLIALHLLVGFIIIGLLSSIVRLVTRAVPPPPRV